MSKCRGPIWEVEDFSLCARQKYIQTFPLVASLVVSGVVVLNSVRKSISKQRRKSDPAYQPLLSQNAAEFEEDEEITDYVCETVSYGAIFDKKNEPKAVIDDVTSTTTSNQTVTIATVIRPTSERIRVAVEWIAATALLGLMTVAVNSPAIYKEWVYNIKWVLVTFWIYAWVLVTVRLAYVRSEDTPMGGLWYHSTSLYSIAFIAAVVPFRSSIIHPYSAASEKFYIAQFALVCVLVYLNFTAKFGNKPARLYLTDPNRPPNNEPVASIFDKVTFSFANAYIWQGYWEKVTSDMVWEMREVDHAHLVMKRFRKFFKRMRLGWALLRTFRWQFLQAWSLAAVFALGVFGPAIFIKLILSYIEDPSIAPKNVAWLYVVGIFAFNLCKSVCNGLALMIGRQVALQLRAILISSIYNKALRRKASATAGKLGEEDKEEKNNNKEEKSEGKSKEPATQANVGAIINLMSVDAFKVAELAPGLHYFTSGILQIFISIFFLYYLLGWSAFVGAAAMMLALPANYWIANTFAKLQKELMGITDQRVEKMNELLQAIRIIKFFAWEDKFAEGVLEYRRQELDVLRRRFLLFSFGAGVFFATPILVTFVTFVSYTIFQGEELTAPIAFTAMALFNLMRSPLDMMAFLFSQVLQAKVSLNRIAEFLGEEETEKYNQLTAAGPGQPHLGFQDASFSWGSDAKIPEPGTGVLDAGTATKPETYNFKLKDLNVEFPVGQLTVIAGPTGSGKTSMLMALLGEMDLDSGKVFLPGACSREDIKMDRNGLCDTVAYCSQQAWLLNDTLRENIIFAGEADENRYQAVIKACQLERDLEILDGGDQTQVGEKGITLSGGQKQRISLARAIYSRSKHLILDDCLSAVDSHTALNIYNECLTGPITQGRTIVLVSHNVALSVSKADKVIVMESGRVKSQGTPAQVASTGALGNDDLVNASVSQSQSQSQSEAPTRVNSSTNLTKDQLQKVDKQLADEAEQNAIGDKTKEKKRGSGKLVDDEYMAEGTVDKTVFYEYMKAMGPWWFFVILGLFFASQQLSNIMTSWWIREWTVKGMVEKVQVSTIHTTVSDFSAKMYVLWDGLGEPSQAIKINGNKPVHSIWYYLGIYVVIGAVNVASGVLKELITYRGGIVASKKLFEQLLFSIIRAKSRFFDSTPIGRLMNRFSKDVEAMDQDLTPITIDFCACLLTVITTLALICFITPGFIIAALLISIMYYAIATMYLTSSRELKRLDSTTRSPIFQSFGETLTGITTIRAYGDQRRFIRDNLKLIDENHRPYYYLWVANRWLYFRVETIGGTVCAAAAFFCLISLGHIDSGLAGLSLSYALTFNEVVLWAVRLYAEVELQGNSLERVQEYTNVESEAAPVIEGSRPPADWPTRGEIEFNDLSLRYAPELPLVIKNASFKVPSFNKIGVVGRTGAGKSTVITALFRLIEADSGFIKIDGLDIATIGLQDLRRALAIIPQDPTLFTGSIRSNLDPFENYTDAQVFEALRRVHLVETAPEQSSSSVHTEDSENANQFLNLNSAVTEGGNNLSQGQRQLMCLARSLLKTPKVLLLDEATASIDYETDARIQNTIREEFQNTTLLTIAHRLRSIADYDKILVMDAGEVAEYGEPYQLLQNKEGIFRSMCENSGEYDALEKIAYDSRKN